MNSNDRILSLLGLSLRGGNLAVGEEPVDAAARAKDARLLLLAADSADNTRRRCEHMALAGNCLWVRLPCTKEQMGRAPGPEFRRPGSGDRHRPGLRPGEAPGGAGPGPVRRHRGADGGKGPPGRGAEGRAGRP